jgi:hypothetical protein
MRVWEVSAMSRLSRAFVVILCAGTYRSSAQQNSLSVCKALSSVGDRQEVTIRGRIAGTWRHGFFGLDEGIHGDPCQGWRARFFTAPSFIPLMYVSALGVQLTNEEERRNFAFVRELFSMSHQTNPNPITVSVSGVVVRKQLPLIFRRVDGSYFGNGIVGGYPTVLVVRSIWKDD